MVSYAVMLASNLVNLNSTYAYSVGLCDGLYAPLKDRLSAPDGAYSSLTLPGDDEGALGPASSCFGNACGGEHPCL